MQLSPPIHHKNSALHILAFLALCNFYLPIISEANDSVKISVLANGTWTEGELQIPASAAIADANAATPLKNLFGLATNDFRFSAMNWSMFAQAVIPNLQASLGLPSSDSLFIHRTVEKDGLRSAHYQRRTNDIPWLFPSIAIHEFASQMRASIQTPSLQLGSMAKIISVEQMRSLVGLDHGRNAELIQKPELFWYYLPSSEPTAVQDARLIYRTIVIDQSWPLQITYYHDAETASRIAAIPNMQDLRQRLVLRGKGHPSDQEKLLNLVLYRQHSPGKPIPFEKNFRLHYSEMGCNPSRFRSPNRIDQDPTEIPYRCRKFRDRSVESAAQHAWDNAGFVDTYFREILGEAAYDNKNSIYRSIVNFDVRWHNAAYVNGLGLVVYGDSAKEDMHHFSHSLDVSAHEWTHALIDNNARLEFQAEPGALNEAYADTLGKFIAIEAGRSDADDWAMGRELFKEKHRYVRDLANPQVGHMRDYQHRGETCDDDNDLCGVHINSGIISLAHVRLVESIGRPKTEQLIKRVLLQFLQPASNFREALAHTKEACRIEFGMRATECKAVERSFRSVGLF